MAGVSKIRAAQFDVIYIHSSWDSGTFYCIQKRLSIVDYDPIISFPKNVQISGNDSKTYLNRSSDSRVIKSVGH